MVADYRPDSTEFEAVETLQQDVYQERQQTHAHANQDCTASAGVMSVGAGLRIREDAALCDHVACSQYGMLGWECMSVSAMMVTAWQTLQLCCCLL